VFEHGSGYVGFVVDKVALGQVFSEYFGFPCQSLFHQLLHNHPHLSSGVCTIGQKWPQYLGTCPTPPIIMIIIIIIEETKVLGENRTRWHFAQRKSDMTRPGTEPWTQRWEADD
jgi:hypothetical protein